MVGVPRGDGFDWSVREGCQHDGLIEQLKEKVARKVFAVRDREHSVPAVP